MNDSINNLDTVDDLAHQPIDSIIEVYISNDNLKAVVNIKPPENGGIGPNMNSLRTAIANKNIIHGVNTKTLINICKEPIYNKDIVIANGTNPINGVDGSYKILFETEKNLKPKVKEDGTVDFYNLEIIENVKKEQILCNITFPTEGKDGMSVFGKKILATKGKPVPSLLGNNTKLNEDGTAILSTIDGQADFVNGKIIVNETLFIEGNIDNSTGNLKVTGNIIVNGEVFPGFTVEAAGNIQINGTVSSATLVAGGNIVLKNGIIGGKLRCDGDLTSRFIENCDTFVKGDIKTDYVLNSNIKCGKTLQATSKISKIIGGCYLVGENIEARTIGSIAGTKTFLELGTDSDIIQRQQELTREIPLLETKVESLIPLISLLKQFEAAKRLTPDKKQALDDAIFTYNQITETIENGKQELEQISESIKSKGYGRIVCTDTIHSGTTVKIGTLQMKVQNPIIGKSIYYSKDNIRIGTA